MRYLSYLLAGVSIAFLLTACSRGAQSSANASPAAGGTVEAAASPMPSAAATEQGSPAASASPGASVAFSDINGIFAEQAIADEAKLGAFGSTSGQFRPNDPLSRGEFVQWLVTLNNAYFADSTGSQLRMPETAEVTFDDVPQSSPYWKYVQALVDAGFVVGVDPQHFAPDRPITRQEMVAIKYQVDVGRKATPDPSDNASKLSDYVDAKEVSPLYITAILLDLHDGGTGDIERVWGKTVYLHPTTPLTRAEAAVALSDIAGRKASDYAPTPSPTASSS
jgi:hypothetical protein